MSSDAPSLFDSTQSDNDREFLKFIEQRLRAEADKKNGESTRILAQAQLLEDLERFLARDWLWHYRELLQSRIGEIENMGIEDTAFVAGLEKALAIVTNEARAHMKRFPSLIDLACKSLRLEFDKQSRHPRYTLMQGFLKLEVSDSAGTAKLSDYEGVLQTLPADVEAIAEAISREQKRLFGRKADPRKILQKLRRQYLGVIKKEGKSDGESIPIRRITARLGKNEKGFRTDEFIIDLSRLIDSGRTTIDGYTLDLQQTKDTYQGILLHGSAGRGYIGFITFRKG